jgi:hypothetical protein
VLVYFVGRGKVDLETHEVSHWAMTELMAAARTKIEERMTRSKMMLCGGYRI